MLPQAFFDRDTVEVARSLVGKYLIRQYGGVTLAAQITETEAYVGRTDKACHAYGCRRTQRTKTLFAPPGTGKLAADEVFLYPPFARRQYCALSRSLTMSTCLYLPSSSCTSLSSSSSLRFQWLALLSRTRSV